MDALSNIILALLLVGAAAALVWSIFRSMKFQQEGKLGIIETFGRFSRVALPGRYFLWPWDSLRADVPLQMFTFETPEQSLLTKSGAPVTLKMVIFYQLAYVSKHAMAAMPPHVTGSPPPPRGSNVVTGTVVRSGLFPAPALRRPVPAATTVSGGAVASNANGPLAPEPNFMSRIMGRRQFLDVEHAAYRAVYTVEDWRGLTEHEAVDVLHQVFAKLDIAKDLFGNDNWLADVTKEVSTRLNERTIRWGVEVHEVNFKDVKFGEMTMKNLFAEGRAEREARIKRIEARTQKEIGDLLGLDAEGILQMRYIDAVRDMAQNSQARILLSGMMPPSAPTGMSNPMLAEDQALGPGALPPPPNLPAFPPPDPAAAPPTLPDGTPAQDAGR